MGDSRGDARAIDALATCRLRFRHRRLLHVALWATSALAFTATVVAVLARRRAIAFSLALALAAMGLGLATATLQTVRIGHSILQRPISSALLAGFVEIREERERSDRIVIRVQRFEASGISSAPPERVRVAVRKGSAPAVGSFVELKAHLSPPLQPLRPGGYDFARDMFFLDCASGYTLGAIKVNSTPVERGFWPRYASAIDDLRETMDKRIRAAIPDDNGSIASALITGKRDAISTPVNERRARAVDFRLSP